MGDDFSIKKIEPKASKTEKATSKKVSSSTSNSSTIKVPEPIPTMKKRRTTKKRRKILLSVSAVFLVLLIVFGALSAIVYVQAKGVYDKAQPMLQTAREAKDAVKAQDLQVSKQKLEQLTKDLAEVENAYQSLSWTAYIPVLGSYYTDGEHGLKAADELITAGTIAVTEIEPYSDLLGLSDGDQSFVDQPADKRIETAVATFSKVTPKLGEIADHLAVAQEEFSKIDPNRYPEKIGDTEVRSGIVSAQKLSDETINVFVNAQPLLELLPNLLGMEEEKKYLLLFQNDKELRPSGGFITAYALMSFDKGKMKVIESENIYDLDAKQRKTIAASEEVLKYHKGVSQAYLRDSNLSPDFKESMIMFEDLLENVSNAPEYDGIIALDTEVLVSTIDVLDGDIFVPEYSENFTTEPDDRCDGCPMVIYELSDLVGRRVGYVREARKDVLGKLMFALMQKALGVSPSIYWGPLTQTLFDQVNQKHILVYMKDEDAQDAFERLNYAGRIQEYEGDYLHINDANMAGAKSNLFVEHFVTQDIDIDSNGTVTKTITLEYKNPTPQSNCNLEDEGLCLNAQLRNWLRVYVPEGSKLVSFDGSETEVITKEELGKTVYEGFMTVDPQGSATVTVVYELPFKVDSDEYKLFIQKQPGTSGHEYTINVNGKEKDVLPLTEDTEFIYKI